MAHIIVTGDIQDMDNRIPQPKNWPEDVPSCYFWCGNCGTYAKKLIIFKNTLGCSNCFHRDYKASPLIKIPLFPGQPNYTKAKDDVIKNRVVSPDDPNVFIDRRTGKPTER
jgi:hypothetical protein